MMRALAEVSVSGVLFLGLAALTLAGGAGVALARTLRLSALSLAASLVGVAGLYLHAGADFLGVAQLLISVAGVSIVILYAALASPASQASVGRLAVGVAAAALLVFLGWLALATRWPRVEAVAAPTTARIGDALLREYLLPFELVALLLLVALVGAMALARRSDKGDA